jgi:Rrf2 family protein
MRISAKADYAVRAALELAASPDGKPVKGTKLAEAQDIPLQFLEHILLDLKRAGLIRTKRGARGGYWLAEDPARVSVADVIRAVEGPLANIQDLPPEETHYSGAAERLRDVWIAIRQNLRVVLESVTLEELAARRLPESVTSLLDEPEAWVVRETGSHDVVG